MSRARVCSVSLGLPRFDPKDFLEKPVNVLLLPFQGIKQSGSFKALLDFLARGLRIQDFTFNAAIALRESLTKDGKMVIAREDASAICQVVKAWESCQERVRIYRGKPLPGSLKPEKPKPKSKWPTSASWSEPTYSEPPPQPPTA